MYLRKPHHRHSWIRCKMWTKNPQGCPVREYKNINIIDHPRLITRPFLNFKIAFIHLEYTYKRVLTAILIIYWYINTTQTLYYYISPSNPNFASYLCHPKFYKWTNNTQWALYVQACEVATIKTFLAGRLVSIACWAPPFLDSKDS